MAYDSIAADSIRELASLRAKLAAKDAVIEKLVGALNAVVNDDGLQDLIAGIGEVPPFWSMAKAALALAAPKEGQ